MATYDSLSAEQKNIVLAWERNQRGWFNSLASLLQQARSLRAAIDASGGPRDIITSLDNGEEIPNSSGISGAHNMTRQEWAQLVALLDNFLTAHDTDAVRQLFAKAAGPVAGR